MIKFFKKIPWYGYMSCFLIIFVNTVLYYLGSLLSKKIGLPIIDVKIPFIDDKIKLIPIFIIPYIFSYAFWFFAPISISLTSKDNFINFAISIIISFIIGFLFFVFLPTSISRIDENLYGKLGNDIFSKLTKLIYDSDGKEYGYNLFPSYHCLVSIYCYLGIRKQKEVSITLKIYTLIMAILICMSTVFTKQHYFLDVIGAILISLIPYIIVTKINIGKIILKKKND